MALAAVAYSGPVQFTLTLVEMEMEMEMGGETHVAGKICCTGRMPGLVQGRSRSPAQGHPSLLWLTN